MKRRRITATCAAVNAIRTPKLYRLARNRTGSFAAFAIRRTPVETAAVERIAAGEMSVRPLRRPNARGSMSRLPSEYASRPAPENEVVTTAMRISAPVSPTKTRSASTNGAGRCPLNASASPTSGARSQVVPRAVSGSAGYAERATRPIRNEMSTAPPIPTKRLRGSVRPGSRVSAARLATVSRPVKASIATGIANAIARPGRRRAQVGALREVVGREEERKAEHDQEHLADDRERGDRDRQAVEARAADEAHARP